MISKADKSHRYFRKYYKAHPEKYKAYQEKRRDAIREYRKKFSSRYKTLISHAKWYELEFTLSFEEYVNHISKSCFYCGGFLPEYGSGLDRIDSRLGYISGNVRPCCKACNRAKSDMTEDEFKAWILQIVHIWIRKKVDEF